MTAFAEAYRYGGRPMTFVFQVPTGGRFRRLPSAPSRRDGLVPAYEWPPQEPEDRVDQSFY
jgi:hypothetical protein